MLASFDVGSEHAVEGPNCWLNRSHTYQAREVPEPEKKKKKNSEKGERWSGRGTAEKRGSEPNQTDTPLSLGSTFLFGRTCLQELLVVGEDGKVFVGVGTLVGKLKSWPGGTVGGMIKAG